MNSSTSICNNCGATNRSDARFCDTCGQPRLAYASSVTGLLVTSHLLKQRYQIVERLGQGGFGAIYKAEDILFNNAIRAIKEMGMSGLNTRELQEAIISFKNEAMLLANLTHPNLPRIYDHFEDHGRWYLVMDCINGETLEKHLEKSPGGKLPLAEVIQVALQLCNVLGYLHNHQPPIIFRDLKPDNVMITADGQLYLIDFGIARFFKPGQAKDTVNLGTSGYAPPEQYGRMQTTIRSDIYSLGATLHQLISGIYPGLNPFFFQPLKLGQPIPGNAALEELIMHMLEMKEEKRPANTDVVKQELQRIQKIRQIMPAQPTRQKSRHTAPVQQISTPPINNPRPTTVNLQPNIIVAQHGGGQYTTISEAIQHATPHAFILVQKGIYKESLILDKDIEIIGSGPKEQIILESNSSHCISMQTSRATVRGLTLRCQAEQNGSQSHALDIPQGQLFVEDCDITSNASAAIAIYNSTTQPTIRYCTIHDSRSDGITIYDDAQGVFEDCEITRNSRSGVRIEDGGNPIFRRCTLHNNQQQGLIMYTNALGTFEDCEFHNNKYSGATITSQSNPLLLRCQLHHNQQSGLEIHQEGQGSFQACEIHSNAYDNVIITTTSAPYFYLCKIYASEQYGISVREYGKGSIEYCEISANKSANINISSGGNPLLQHNKITKSKHSGIYVHDGGQGTIEYCAITENLGKALEIAPECVVALKKNQI